MSFSILAIAIVLLLFLLIVGLVAFVAYLLINRNAPKPAGPRPDANQRPLDILQERYARGEITREQYQELRRDLDPESE